jgi:hypothetical protein
LLEVAARLHIGSQLVCRRVASLEATIEPLNWLVGAGKDKTMNEQTLELCQQVWNGEITIEALRAERDAILERRNFSDEEEERYKAVIGAICLAPAGPQNKQQS